VVAERGTAPIAPNVEVRRSRPGRAAATRPPDRRRGRGDDGVALLEFALILPFLATLVFGGIDLGRAFSLQNRLTNMAREGAMYAQFFPARVISASASDNCAVQSITSRAMGEDPSLSDVSVTVTDLTTGTSITGCDATTVAAGDRIEIKVSETHFQPLTPLVRVLSGSNKTVSGSIQVVAQG
jgi:Flp pilus assembly protein TadG